MTPYSLVNFSTDSDKYTACLAYCTTLMIAATGSFKTLDTSIRLHGVTSQMTVLFTVTATITSNLISNLTNLVTVNLDVG
jgi:hypothetical protein